MDDFRKPRPDDPILPLQALYQKPPKAFKRPKGRRGRKPKGRPLKPRGQDRKFNIIKKTDEARKGRELAIKQVKDKERRGEEDIKLRRDQLRLEDQSQQDTARFRAAQVQRATRTQLNQQALEDRRQRDLQNIFAFFQRSFLDAERRTGDNQVRFQETIARLQDRGQGVSREDIRGLQQQQEELIRLVTPRSARPSPQAEAQRETTDISSAQLRRQRSRATPERDLVPSPDDQAVFNEAMDTAFREEKREKFRQERSGGGSVRLAPVQEEEAVQTPRQRAVARKREAQGRPPVSPQVAQEVLAGSPPSGIKEETLSERIARQREPIQPTLSKEEQEEIRFKIYEGLTRTASKGRGKVEEVKEEKPAWQVAAEKQFAEAQKGRAQTTKAFASAFRPQPEPEPQTAPPPSPREFFESLKTPATPTPIKIGDTPYEQLIKLQQPKKVFLSRKVRGQPARVFDEGDTQFILKGNIKGDRMGSYAVDAIDGNTAATQRMVFKDLNTDPNSDEGYGTILLSEFNRRIGDERLDVVKRVIGEEEE